MHAPRLRCAPRQQTKAQLAVAILSNKQRHAGAEQQQRHERAERKQHGGERNQLNHVLQRCEGRVQDRERTPVRFTLCVLQLVVELRIFEELQVEHERLASFYRIILLIPAVIPGALIFVLWKWMYDFHIGPINTILILFGWFTERTAPQWLGGTPLTLPAVAAFEVWWGLGYHTMFFLAGLASIPKDLSDAARIDGANEWKLFWYVTMPRLLPILSILVVLRFGSAMSVIEEYLIFGGFNRASPTYTWTVYMYDLAFHIGDWLQGYAAAIGWIGASAMMFVVAGMLYAFRSRD